MSQQPRPRLFHAAALLGDTMVVLGGRSDPDEFSSDVLLYQVNCNTWLLPDLTRKSLLLSWEAGGHQGKALSLS